MFQKLTRKLLKEVDNKGELKSLSSVYEAKRLDVLSIVKIVESRKFLLHKTKSYIPTGVKLQELLQGTDTVDFGGCLQASIGTVDITEEWVGNAGVRIELPSIQNAEMSCNVSCTTSTTEIQLESMFMSPSKLQNRAVDEGHYLFQEMKRNKNILGLGVVYEILKNRNTMILAQAIKGEGKAKFSVSRFPLMEAGGKVDRMGKLKVDEGCVLGFKVYPLLLKVKTKDPTARRGIFSDGVAEFGEEVAGDFPTLKRLVEAELRDFGEMDRSVKKLIWNPLYEILKCPQALYALDCMLEEGGDFTGSSSLQDVPEDVKPSVHDLLQMMGLDSSESSDSHSLLKPIGFLVSALSELDQETVTPIVLLDGEDRGQVLKLVEGVLEQVCSTDGGVPPHSGELSANTMEKATQILTSCGLKLSEDILDPSLGSPGAPDVTLLALYIALMGLNMLLGP